MEVVQSPDFTEYPQPENWVSEIFPVDMPLIPRRPVALLHQRIHEVFWHIKFESSGSLAYHPAMLIFGFKPKRFKEWAEVVRREGRPLAPWRRFKLALTILGAGLRLGWGSWQPVGRAQWRGRLRICGKCPVYDRRLRQCKATLFGVSAGCSCFVPFIGLVKTPCWGKTHAPKEWGIGWD